MSGGKAAVIAPRQVVAYREDVWAWVYFDQIDQVLRYEAYVVGYDDSGSPQTLEVLLEEGLVSLSEWSLEELSQLLPWEANLPSHRFPLWPHISVSKTSLYLKHLSNIYQTLESEQLVRLHRCFAQIESGLKKRHQSRWKQRLRALGYDVIESAG